MSDFTYITSRPDVKRVRALIKDDDPTSWDKVWKENLTPWDSGDIQPALREAFEDSKLGLPRTGRALVPGCGSGYDPLYLATLGLDTVGFDVSETAVDTANKLLASKADLKSAVIRFELGDFFALTVSEDNKFDVVYDYTFFVAIPPSRRMEWGRKMAELIKPGGHLITLVFPIIPYADVGPPFFVRPDHYLEPLGSNFEKVLDKDPNSSIPSHVGQERLVVWKRVEA